jgi:hypothetical protein
MVESGPLGTTGACSITGCKGPMVKRCAHCDKWASLSVPLSVQLVQAFVSEQYLLSVYCVPGTELSVGTMMPGFRNIPADWEAK